MNPDKKSLALKKFQSRRLGIFFDILFLQLSFI